jgi:hypothetical protein
MIRDGVASVLLKDVILVWKSKMPCFLLRPMCMRNICDEVIMYMYV